MERERVQEINYPFCYEKPEELVREDEFREEEDDGGRHFTDEMKALLQTVGL
jgi:hypothetical protein